LNKTCKTCYRSKPVVRFPKHPSFADGFDTSCKSCRSLLRSAKRMGGLEAYRDWITQQIMTIQTQAVAKKRAFDALVTRREEAEHLLEVSE